MKDMGQIAVFGTGKSLQPILETIINIEWIHFFIDNSVAKIGTEFKGKPIIAPQQLVNYHYHAIIIATVDYEKVLQQLNSLGVIDKDIISFYDPNIEYKKYAHIFQIGSWEKKAFETRIFAEVEKFIKRQELAMRNMEYEIADKLQKVQYNFPQIASIKETLDKIIEDKVSISRYGDGEFEIIAGHAKDPYQGNNAELASRLKEILISHKKNHIVGLANDYGSLEENNETSKYEIRKYMTKEKRAFHESLIDMNRQYYNAYLSRPYAIFENGNMEEIKQKFCDLRKIWQGQKLLFVEGDTTRMGVGNNLFDNSKSIERIIAPSKNAYSKYKEILGAVCKVEKDRLILIALGPAATVLAYDLAEEGYWALDIGHLDIEYEWFLKGKGATYVPYKYNNEVYGGEFVEDIYNKEYDSQIIKIIG